MQDLSPEPAPGPPVPEPAADVLATAEDFTLPTWPRRVDEKGRPKWSASDAPAPARL